MLGGLPMFAYFWEKLLPPNVTLLFLTPLHCILYALPLFSQYFRFKLT